MLFRGVRKWPAVFLLLTLTFLFSVNPVIAMTDITGNEIIMEKIDSNNTDTQNYLNLLKEFQNDQINQTRLQPQSLSINPKNTLQLQNLLNIKPNSENPRVVETEPNNSISKADTIHLDDYVFGTITNYYYDLDYYKLTIPQDCTLKTIGIFDGYEKYLAICLLDKNNKILKSSSYISAAEAQYLEYKVSAGTYYLVVLQTVESNYLVGNMYGLVAYSDDISTDIPVTSISVEPSNLTFIEGDEPQNITVTLSPSNATDRYYNWYSSNGTVATIKDNKVIPGKPGTTTITLTPHDGGNCSTKIYVTVNPKGSTIPVEKITLDIEAIYFPEINLSEQIYAEVEPSNATNKSVIWSSDNTDIATVSQDGTVTAVNFGNTIIRAKSVDGNCEAICNVCVYNENEIPNMTPKSNYESGSYKNPIEVELTTDMYANIYYTLDGSDPIENGDIYEELIKINKTTTLKTYAEYDIGESNVISFEYVIQSVKVKSLSITPKTLKLPLNRAEQLEVIATYTNKTKEDVTEECSYSSTDEDVITVDEYGCVESVGKGKCKIWVEYGGKKKSIGVVVR
ncbi:cell adhesion protein [Desulfocucumis palustris]|uniref:Cell adhesion protein n=1 Tax=Desulfocucumis palustris TaxID=1898651 RepID=A0A2L2X837_9FIRM|nr:Ig-like domain-containing protein [Desulfocucumis palustris]GBF32268.1 cell adhesion protein [Desulfocucumis palustris]